MVRLLVVILLIFGLISCKNIGDGVYSPVEKSVVSAASTAALKLYPDAVIPVYVVTGRLLSTVDPNEMITVSHARSVLLEKATEQGFSAGQITAFDNFLRGFVDKLRAKYEAGSDGVPLEKKITVARQIVETIHESARSMLGLPVMLDSPGGK